MIAPAKPHTPSIPAWHNRLLALLPAVLRQARIAFHSLDSEKREDALAEVVASTFTAYARLVELDKEDLAFATPLARYAICRYHDGRHVGTKFSARDVTSKRCQRLQNIKVKSFHRFDPDDGQWREILVEDKHATPADVATTRIDFAAWLSTLTPRERSIAMKLAEGERTGTVATMFGVSAGRISQMRAELCQAWNVFVGDLVVDEASTCVA
jgi:hypothetical protein